MIFIRSIISDIFRTVMIGFYDTGKSVTIGDLSHYPDLLQYLRMNGLISGLTNDLRS